MAGQRPVNCTGSSGVYSNSCIQNILVGEKRVVVTPLSRPTVQRQNGDVKVRLYFFLIKATSSTIVF